MTAEQMNSFAELYVRQELLKNTGMSEQDKINCKTDFIAGLQLASKMSAWGVPSIDSYLEELAKRTL